MLREPGENEVEQLQAEVESKKRDIRSCLPRFVSGIEHDINYSEVELGGIIQRLCQSIRKELPIVEAGMVENKENNTCPQGQRGGQGTCAELQSARCASERVVD
jgi:hypothetical protein